MPKLTKEQLAQIEEYVSTLPEDEREAKLNEVVKQFEEQPTQCPFCLMSEGKLKTTNVYSDSKYLAVLEINPVNPGHVLLFPKKHIKTFAELSGEEVEEICKIAKKLDFSLLGIYGGVNILISEGEVAGQKFTHLVVNIIPRVADDAVSISWRGKPVDEKVLNEVKDKIISGIPIEVKHKVEEKIDVDDIKKRMFRRVLP